MMMMTYEEIQKVNEQIQTIEIKGNQYAKVSQRIKAFRMLYPTGAIKTEIVSLENGVCVIHATVGYNNEGRFDGDRTEFVVLGEGTACEKESSSFINKASYIENCETSAVGRALGMCGLGIDSDVASAEEVQTATLNTETISTEQRKSISKQLADANIPAEYVCDLYGLEQIKDMTVPKLDNLVANWDKFVKKYHERKDS